MTEILYRLGEVDDLHAVHALNQALFAEAWSKQSLLDVMLSGFDLYVVEAQGVLVGYILSQDILDETHIMQVAVSSDFQRQGIAKRLSQMLFNAKPKGTTFMLEVRRSNRAAQVLYRKLGFQEVGCRKKYYIPLAGDNQREDAILMSFTLPSKP